MTTDCRFAHFIALIGRIFIASVFLCAGLEKLMNFQLFATELTTHGVPMSTLILGAIVLLELAGGLLVLLGLFTRFGAVLLLIFGIAGLFVFHSFGMLSNTVFAGVMPSFKHMHFLLTHIAVLGGVLYILAFGAGRFSADACRCRHSGKCSPCEPL